MQNNLIHFRSILHMEWAFTAQEKGWMNEWMRSSDSFAMYRENEKSIEKENCFTQNQNNDWLKRILVIFSSPIVLNKNEPQQFEVNPFYPRRDNFHWLLMPAFQSESVKNQFTLILEQLNSLKYIIVFHFDLL